VRTAFPKPPIALLALAFAICGQNVYGQDGQTQPPPQPAGTPQPSTSLQSHKRSPGGDVGSGAGDIGKGAGKGTLAAAKGVGKGTADLVTLRPLDAAGNVGKGAPSPAKTSASALPRAQAKLPRAQAGALANYSTSTMRRKTAQLPKNHKTRESSRSL
jgi:hypothetical protein